VASETSQKIKNLGGFELIEKVGQGGMGAVFRARQVSLDREVALKVLPPKIAQRDPVFVERFIREARTSAKLNHPNIVQGIEVGKDEATGLYYFAMEYIDGPSAKALIKQQRVVDEKRTLEISLGVAQALIFAHRAGIVHRDIKPDNILLTSRGEPKLADLGLARQALDPDHDSSHDKNDAKDDPFGIGGRDSELTQAGSAVGTPSYMAPEQVRGEMDKIDARTDLYELGATMFHMLTGKPPYVGENSKAVMVMHLTTAVPEARAVNPVVSEATSKLVYKLMQKEQSKRVQSPEEVAREIDRILHGGAERVKGTGKQAAISGRYGSGTERPVTKEHAAWGTHLTGATAAAAAKSGRSPQEEQKKAPVLLYIGIAVAVLAAGGLVYMFALGGFNRAGSVAKAKDDGNAQQPVPPAGPDNSGAHLENPTPVNPPAKTDPQPPNHNQSSIAVAVWEPFEKARKAAQATAGDYAADIKLFEEAEKGAPPGLIPDIRHERLLVERARDAAFRKVLEVPLRKARGLAAKADFAGALTLLHESVIPPALLCESSRIELGRARGEIEQVAAAGFKSIDDELTKEFEAAGDSLSKLQGVQQKIAVLAKSIPVNTVQERLGALAKAIEHKLGKINAALGQRQDAAYSQAVEAAWSSAKSGNFTDSVAALARIKAEPVLAERFGSKVDAMIRDLGAVQELQKKACEGLIAKLNVHAEVSVHPLGGAVLNGKLTTRDRNLFSIEDKTNGLQLVDGSKLDPSDALELGASKADAGERKYISAAYYFWLGKPQRAYEGFAQLQKEKSPESESAAVYTGWMNARATELMNRIADSFHEVQRNGSLSPDEKKAKQTDAGALLNRLRNDFGTTEAYLARKQKK
jgi:tRNA A-37 threonylcarbamoyl transferase component Bud32